MNKDIRMGDKRMIRSGFFFAALVLASTSASWAARNYGMAGCGLGSMVFKKNERPVLAATTNGTFANQLFGISSGTLNCTEDGVALAEKEKEYFSGANFESLMQEMAQGSGENLQAMATLYGCSGPEFARAMQANYGRIFAGADADAQDMLAGVEDVIQTDSGLQGACSELN